MPLVLCFFVFLHSFPNVSNTNLAACERSKADTAAAETPLTPAIFSCCVQRPHHSVTLVTVSNILDVFGHFPCRRQSCGGDLTVLACGKNLIFLTSNVKKKL